jgi:hypothetical protein
MGSFKDLISTDTEALNRQRDYFQNNAIKDLVAWREKLSKEYNDYRKKEIQKQVKKDENTGLSDLEKK